MNINDKVSVTFTAYGFELFLRIDHDGSMYKYNYNAVTNILTIELWQLMNMFGKHIYHGSKQIFENNEITIKS